MSSTTKKYNSELKSKTKHHKGVKLHNMSEEILEPVFEEAASLLCEIDELNAELENCFEADLLMYEKWIKDS